MAAPDSKRAEGFGHPILFLIIDCLRADRALAQAELAPDGFLGRLVRRSRVFTGAITVTPTTTPAVTSMLTGLYPFEHGVRGLLGFKLPESVPTVAMPLREAGYYTEADVSGPLLPELRIFKDFDESRWIHRTEASLHGSRGEALAARISALRSGDRPWFLFVHVWDLHEPRQVPRSFRGRALSRSVYDRSLAALDDRLDRLLPDDALEDITVCLVGDHGENLRLEPRGKLGMGFSSLLWWKPTKWAMQPFGRRMIARGARSSSKRILRLAPRALITHGHHLFDPLLRVPYLLAGPTIPPGRSNALVSHVDLAPTLAEIAGTSFLGGVGSRSLPLNGGGDPDRRVVLETAWVTPLQGVPQVGLRTPAWKYMEVAGGSAPALFDLIQDPAERRNLVQEQPQVTQELREELHTTLATGRLGDEMSDDESELVESRLKDLGYLE